MKQDNKTEVKESIRAIFSINGVKGMSQVKVHHLDNMSLKAHEHVPDELVERYEIIKNVFGEIYVCHITDVFLMSSKQLPLMYVSVVYEQPLRRVLLYRVYLQFEIKSEIKSVKELLNGVISGKFELEIDIENIKKKLDENILEYPGKEKMVARLKDFTCTEDMKGFNQGLMDEVRVKLIADHADYFDAYEPPKNVISLKDYVL